MTMTSPSNVLWDLLLAQPHDENSIMQCLYDHSDCCSLVIDDKLAIHVAIEQGLSMDIIKQMLICYPACCSGKNEKGNMLLHDLLLNEDHRLTSYIYVIMDSNVEAARTVDKHGSLPIHMECMNHCRFDVVMKLLYIYPDAISMMDASGRCPLHSALVSGHSSYELISYLIYAYPDAVHISDEDGSLPLHKECLDKCRYDVIIKLLDIYPDAIRIKDGSYPLHSAIGSNCCSYEAVIHLIDAYPDAVCLPDNFGSFPLHIECQYHCRYDVVLKLLDIYPDAITIADISGCFPLHCAIHCDCTCSSYEVVSHLINAYPDAIRIPDCDGNLPLHLACSTKCCYDIIKLLYDIYPDAVVMRGSFFFLPLNHVFSTYYKPYIGAYSYTSPNSSKQSMQYKALMTSMIETCYSYHATSGTDFNIMYGFDMERDDDPMIRYRLLLNLAAHHLSSTSAYMIDYRDRNYHPRSHLLHHVYLLSSSSHMKPSLYKYSDMYDGSLHAVLISMLAAAGMLYMTHDSTHDHVVDIKYGWINRDDIGCLLLRKVVLYL